MTRAVSDVFVYNNNKYIVRRGNYNANDLCHCDERCAFHDNKLECRRNIKITGDCQPNYRNDNAPVYFEKYGNKTI